MLGYMIKSHLYTHKDARRDNGRRGSPNNTLPDYPQAYPQEPPAHQRLICTSPEEHSGMLRQAGTQAKNSQRTFISYYFMLEKLHWMSVKDYQWLTDVPCLLKSSLSTTLSS